MQIQGIVSMNKNTPERASRPEAFQRKLSFGTQCEASRFLERLSGVSEPRWFQERSGYGYLPQADFPSFLKKFPSY